MESSKLSNFKTDGVVIMTDNPMKKVVKEALKQNKDAYISSVNVLHHVQHDVFR